MKNIVRGLLFVPMWVSWLCGLLFQCLSSSFVSGRLAVQRLAEWLDT